MFASKDKEGREVGEERVYRLFARQSPHPGDEFVDATLSAIETFREGAESLEDITFLTVVWKGA